MSVVLVDDRSTYLHGSHLKLTLKAQREILRQFNESVSAGYVAHDLVCLVYLPQDHLFELTCPQDVGASLEQLLKQIISDFTIAALETVRDRQHSFMQSFDESRFDDLLDVSKDFYNTQIDEELTTHSHQETTQVVQHHIFILPTKTWKVKLLQFGDLPRMLQDHAAKFYKRSGTAQYNPNMITVRAVRWNDKRQTHLYCGSTGETPPQYDETALQALVFQPSSPIHAHQRSFVGNTLTVEKWLAGMGETEQLSPDVASDAGLESDRLSNVDSLKHAAYGKTLAPKGFPSAELRQFENKYGNTESMVTKEDLNKRFAAITGKGPASDDNSETSRFKAASLDIFNTGGGLTVHNDGQRQTEAGVIGTAQDQNNLKPYKWQPQVPQDVGTNSPSPSRHSRHAPVEEAETSLIPTDEKGWGTIDTRGLTGSATAQAKWALENLSLHRLPGHSAAGLNSPTISSRPFDETVDAVTAFSPGPAKTEGQNLHLKNTLIHIEDDPDAKELISKPQDDLAMTVKNSRNVFPGNPLIPLPSSHVTDTKATVIPKAVMGSLIDLDDQTNPTLHIASDDKVDSTELVEQLRVPSPEPLIQFYRTVGQQAQRGREGNEEPPKTDPMNERKHSAVVQSKAATNAMPSGLMNVRSSAARVPLATRKTSPIDPKHSLPGQTTKPPSPQRLSHILETLFTTPHAFSELKVNFGMCTVDARAIQTIKKIHTPDAMADALAAASPDKFAALGSFVEQTIDEDDSPFLQHLSSGLRRDFIEYQSTTFILDIKSPKITSWVIVVKADGEQVINPRQISQPVCLIDIISPDHVWDAQMAVSGHRPHPEQELPETNLHLAVLEFGRTFRFSESRYERTWAKCTIPAVNGRPAFEIVRLERREMTSTRVFPLKEGSFSAALSLNWHIEKVVNLCLNCTEGAPFAFDAYEADEKQMSDEYWKTSLILKNSQHPTRENTGVDVSNDLVQFEGIIGEAISKMDCVGFRGLRLA